MRVYLLLDVLYWYHRKNVTRREAFGAIRSEGFLFALEEDIHAKKTQASM